ncbi:hypothetical protein IQ06DRAFT_54682 [Phaeosphaeriaceae sp. SRC1lsM3a]|nr:hypothetical protein IQ06DRAFT_54682 [Stagonospora sp. SRC1lsM3a]
MPPFLHGRARLSSHGTTDVPTGYGSLVVLYIAGSALQTSLCQDLLRYSQPKCMSYHSALFLLSKVRYHGLTVTGFASHCAMPTLTTYMKHG